MMSLPNSANGQSSFGLTQVEINQVTQVLQAFESVQSALLFGSRAKGSHKPGSDIDIALIGDNLETSITQIAYQLNEESLLPYFFDIIDYKNLSNQALKEHIDRVGIQFYSR